MPPRIDPDVNHDIDQTLFISDLHLSPQHPRITALFISFLQQRAVGVATLYILGDLFDYWVGDDDPTPPRTEVIRALRQLVDAGTCVYVLQGNRDFLLAQDFANECGGKILNDCIVIDCNGEPTLLMHGDLLCTDDVAYQQFRALSRGEQWRNNVLAKPLWLRLALVRWYRFRSYLHKQGQSAEIMDVNPVTAWEYAKQHQVAQIIHGHTHRPGSHCMVDNNHTLKRHVLGSWGDSARILVLNENGLQFEQISLNTSGELECEVIQDSLRA
jgi:UDP-2,3-diacylglucosamine hydrolase